MPPEQCSRTLCMSRRDEPAPQKQNNDGENNFKFYSQEMITPKSFLLFQDESWKSLSQIFVLLYDPGTETEGVCE